MQKASPQNYYHYNKSLQPFANALRKNMTKAEACLWKYVLRAKRLENYAFRRQRSILNYIVDFVCFELMLVIEVDGITHTYEITANKDERKTADLESVGFTVMRFDDANVLTNINGVYEILLAWISDFENIEDIPTSHQGERNLICTPPNTIVTII